MDSYIRALINSETKRKAMFVAKCEGINLSEVIRDAIQKYADEFDKKYGKEN